MVNYQNGKIYKITGTTDEGEELIYIGSTTLSLCQRLAGHKCYAKQGNYYSSKQVVLCNDCLITLIELYPSNSKDELLMRERYYYDLYDCVNMVRPFRFKEEDKEIKKKYQNEYHNKNREQILEKQKEYHKKNREQILEKQKEYREENREILRKIANQFYENNKELIKQQRKETTTCECGCIIRKDCLSQHKKSKIHIQH